MSRGEDVDIEKKLLSWSTKWAYICANSAAANSTGLGDSFSIYSVSLCTDPRSFLHQTQAVNRPQDTVPAKLASPHLLPSPPVVRRVHFLWTGKLPTSI